VGRDPTCGLTRVERRVVDLKAVLARDRLVETPARLHAPQRIDAPELPECSPVFGDDSPVVDPRSAAEAHERHFTAMSLDNGNRVLDEPIVLNALAVVSLPTPGIP
jgi:hypothetical protein